MRFRIAAMVVSASSVLLTSGITKAADHQPPAKVYRYHGKVVPAKVARAIERHFGGRYTWQAIKVSFCESGWRTTARNGQYLGLFQMGRWARGRYGHGTTADIQAKAASALFRASGKDWSPWECKP